MKQHFHHTNVCLLLFVCRDDIQIDRWLLLQQFSLLKLENLQHRYSQFCSNLTCGKCHKSIQEDLKKMVTCRGSFRTRVARAEKKILLPIKQKTQKNLWRPKKKVDAVNFQPNFWLRLLPPNFCCPGRAALRPALKEPLVTCRIGNFALLLNLEICTIPLMERKHTVYKNFNFIFRLRE